MPGIRLKTLPKGMARPDKFHPALSSYRDPAAKITYESGQVYDVDEDTFAMLMAQGPMPGVSFFEPAVAPSGPSVDAKAAAEALVNRLAADPAVLTKLAALADALQSGALAAAEGPVRGMARQAAAPASEPVSAPEPAESVDMGAEAGDPAPDPSPSPEASAPVDQSDMKRGPGRPKGAKSLQDLKS